MHTRLFVTFNTQEAATSHEARQHVDATLRAEGFCAPDGRWSHGMADWFVIGGRWSGELSRHSWAKALYARIAALEQARGVQVWGASYADPNVRKAQQALEQACQALWRTAAPQPYRRIPINRDTYRELGYADDAMLLTQELYDALLTEYAGATDSEYHADLHYDEVSPTMVGKKWIVVVDYHS